MEKIISEGQVLSSKGDVCGCVGARTSNFPEKPQNSSPNNSGLFLFEHTGPLVQLGKIKASLLPSAKQCPFDGTCQMGLSPFYDMSLQFHTTNIVVVCITLVV